MSGQPHPNVTGRKLPDRLVCARYDICPRTLSRWDENPKLGFPRPFRINGRKYRDEKELDAFDRRLVADQMNP
jgi:hypothetical protein